MLDFVACRFLWVIFENYAETILFQYLFVNKKSEAGAFLGALPQTVALDRFPVEVGLASLTVFVQIHAARTSDPSSLPPRQVCPPDKPRRRAQGTSRTAEGGYVVSKTVHEDVRKMWGAAAHFNWKPV